MKILQLLFPRLAKAAETTVGAVVRTTNEPSAGTAVRPGSEHLFGIGAILADLNGDIQVSLRVRASEKRILKLLEGSWGIVDRESAIALLEWLRDEGHRTQYEKYIKPAFTYEPPSIGAAYKAAFSRKSERSSYFPSELDGLGDNTKIYMALDRLNTARREITRHGYVTDEQFMATTIMDAWDIDRIGNLVRFCSTVGFITEDEAYEWLELAYAWAQELYPSWGAYGASFLIGRALAFEGEIEDVAVNVSTNLGSKRSPWTTHPLH